MKFFEQTEPPNEDDLKAAAKLEYKECPRRYCWWWRSLSFDWEVSPVSGCTYLESDRPPSEHMHTPCSRAFPESDVDHFESRGWYIENDGFDRFRFHDPVVKFRILGREWDEASGKKRPPNTW